MLVNVAEQGDGPGCLICKNRAFLGSTAEVPTFRGEKEKICVGLMEFETDFCSDRDREEAGTKVRSFWSPGFVVGDATLGSAIQIPTAMADCRDHAILAHDS